MSWNLTFAVSYCCWGTIGNRRYTKQQRHIIETILLCLAGRWCTVKFHLCSWGPSSCSRFIVWKLVFLLPANIVCVNWCVSYVTSGCVKKPICFKRMMSWLFCIIEMVVHKKICQHAAETVQIQVPYFLCLCPCKHRGVAPPKRAVDIFPGFLGCEFIEHVLQCWLLGGGY